eukprot:3703146-Rhodomonas_salina.3
MGHAPFRRPNPARSNREKARGCDPTASEHTKGNGARYNGGQETGHARDRQRAGSDLRHAMPCRFRPPS